MFCLTTEKPTKNFGVGVHGPDLISQRREYETCALCGNSNLTLT